MTATELNTFINTNSKICYYILQSIDIDGFIEFSDEYHIYLKSMTNIQNYRRQSPTEANYLFEIALHSPMITL